PAYIPNHLSSDAFRCRKGTAGRIIPSKTKVRPVATSMAVTFASLTKTSSGRSQGSSSSGEPLATRGGGAGSLERHARDVGADHGDGEASLLDLHPGKTCGADGGRGVAVRVAAIGQDLPQRSESALYGTATASAGRSHVLHEGEASAGAQHAQDLSQGLRQVVHRAEDERAKDAVEGGVLERKAFGGAAPNFALHPLGAQPHFQKLARVGIGLERHVVDAAAEVVEIGARAGTDLQDPAFQTAEVPALPGGDQALVALAAVGEDGGLQPLVPAKVGEGRVARANVRFHRPEPASMEARMEGASRAMTAQGSLRDSRRILVDRPLPPHYMLACPRHRPARWAGQRSARRGGSAVPPFHHHFTRRTGSSIHRCRDRLDRDLPAAAPGAHAR